MSRMYTLDVYARIWELKKNEKLNNSTSLYFVYFSLVVWNGLYAQGRRACPGKVGDPDILEML
jgi:hypothetical protein